MMSLNVNNNIPLAIYGNNFEEVERFEYLGSILTTGGGA